MTTGLIALFSASGTVAVGSTASTKGTASVKYPIAGATPGRKVVVEVSAKQGNTTWKCTTSFTPKKR